MKADKPKVRLEEWRNSMFYIGSLEGKAYDHPRFEDGTWVVTSSVDQDKRKDYAEGDVVETQNTLYTLGKPYIDSSR